MPGLFKHLPLLRIIGTSGAVFSLLLSACGCSTFRAEAAPTSSFLAHADQLRSISEDSPWDAVWSSNPGEIMVKKPEMRTIFIAPVNIEYLNMKKDETGALVKERDIPQEDVAAITNLMHSSFSDAIKNSPAANLTLTDQRNRATLLLELALIELVPTKVLVNTVVDIGGAIIPGSKALEETAAVGGQAAGGAFAAGTIAFEGRIIDGKTSTVVAEFKDRENDPASIIPNYRDFEEYGWSRNTIAEWSQEFALVFSSDSGAKVEAPSEFSFVPW